MKPKPHLPYQISTRPLNRILHEKVARMGGEVAGAHIKLARTLSPGESDKDALASIRDLYSGKTRWIDFDVADRYLARLGLTMLWRTDPELNEEYESVNLRMLDIRRPTCPRAAEFSRRWVRLAYRCVGTTRVLAGLLGVSQCIAHDLVRDAGAA